jgi:hypothetical protein
MHVLCQEKILVNSVFSLYCNLKRLRIEWHVFRNCQNLDPDSPCPKKFWITAWIIPVSLGIESSALR